MRVVHIITRFLTAGAEENTLLSCNGQVEKGHEVHIIYGHDFDEGMCAKLDPRVKQHTAKHLTREINPSTDWKAYKEMTAILRDMKPDIVHTHTSKAGVIGRFAAKKAKVPCVIHGVHMLAFAQVSFLKKWIYLLMEKAVVKKTHAFINVSEGTQTECLKFNLGRADQHYVVPSGMDVKKFIEAKPPKDWKDLVDAAQVKPESPKFVLFVGSFEPRKNHVAFLDEFAKTVKACPDAVLLLLGQGETESEIKAKTAQLGLEGHVVCVGFKDNVEQYMALSDIGVLPSLREGLPRVVIQYVLSGLPVVCSHTPGIERLVDDGQNGRLVPISTLERMGEHMAEYLNDDVVHRDARRAALDKDLSAWDADNMVNEIEKIYTKYANGNAS